MTIEEAAQQQVSIIISCLYEEDTIAECIERVSKALPNAEILIIHGGDDGTLEVAKKMAESNPRIKPYKNENDEGKGHAIQVGIELASHDIMCQFDADLQFDPEDLPKLFVEIFNGNAELVLGSRFMHDSDTSDYSFSFFRVVGNHVVNFWISLLCGTRITDVTAGSKAWTRDAIKKINFQDRRFVYEVEIPVRAHVCGLEIAQVPIGYHNRQGGVSGHGNGLKGLWSIIRCGFMLLWTATRIRLSGK